MLLEFKTKNYKSFVDEMVFSMTPAPKQKGLDYSILYKKKGWRTRSHMLYLEKGGLSKGLEVVMQLLLLYLQNGYKKLLITTRVIKEFRLLLRH